jgi:hypothetical protein
VIEETMLCCQKKPLNSAGRRSTTVSPTKSRNAANERTYDESKDYNLPIIEDESDENSSNFSLPANKVEDKVLERREPSGAAKDTPPGTGESTNSPVSSGIESARVLGQARSSADISAFEKVKRKYAGRRPLLYHVCSDRSIDALRVLLSQDEEPMDVNENGPGAGVPPLVHASAKGFADIVKVLLAVPTIDVNLGNHEDETALYMACQYGHEDIAQLLIAHPDIDIDKANIDGETPLSEALEMKNDRIADMLRARGARR